MHSFHWRDDHSTVCLFFFFSRESLKKINRSLFIGIQTQIKSYQEMLSRNFYCGTLDKIFCAFSRSKHHLCNVYFYLSQRTFFPALLSGSNISNFLQTNRYRFLGIGEKERETVRERKRPISPSMDSHCLSSLSLPVPLSLPRCNSPYQYGPSEKRDIASN